MKEEDFIRPINRKPITRAELQEMSWNDIKEPGAYVEVGSGDLYRVPYEALVKGATLVIMKESLGISRFIKISENPFVALYAARSLCAHHNIQPNF
jgi:hypothetical protein